MAVSVRTKVKDIKTHEEIIENKLIETLESIMEEGLKNPVIVDKESKVLLDGHHRLKSFQILGLREIPAIEVDYFSSEVEMQTRRDIDISKEDIINTGLSNSKFPAKTTKHIFSEKIESRLKNSKINSS